MMEYILQLFCFISSRKKSYSDEISHRCFVSFLFCISGNAFVFDLLAIVHWRLANAMPSGAVVDFVPKQRTMIAYGTTNGTVSLMDLGEFQKTKTEK